MVWKVGPVGRIVSVLAALASTGLAVVLIVGMFKTLPIAPGIIVAIAFLAGAVWFMARAFRSSIEIAGSTLVVKNAFRGHEVRLEDISSVVPGYSGLRIHLRDSGCVVATCVEKWNIARLLHIETRADDVVAQIMAARKRELMRGEVE